MKQPKATTPANSKRRIVRRFTGRMRLTAIAVFVVLVVGAVMMLAANQPTEDAATPEPLKLVSAPEVEPAPPTRKTASRKPAAAVVPAKATAVPAKATASPTAAAAPAVASSPASASSVIKGEVVTITGCLEVDNQEYRLTSTEGADAPKSRSWKSGFLKKRTTDVEVLDASRKLRLATHLGQRVSVTGVVNERKMEAMSLVVASRSCN